MTGLSLVIVMLAPNPSKWFFTSGGNTYQSSSIGLIVNVMASDILSLQQQGCILLVPRNNVNATRGPLNTDDFTAGYGIGSFWINVGSSPVEVYVCTIMGSISGNAVWSAVLSSATLNTVEVVTATTSVILSTSFNYFSIRQGSPTAINITLPVSPAQGYFCKIKDALGVCNSIVFTVNTSDSTLIDGSSTFLFNQGFQEQSFSFDGTGWCVGD